MGHANSLLGRQPILNRAGELIGYELLFRQADPEIPQVDASQATANVILNTLTGFGVADILGNHRGYINLEQELLMHDSLHLLPKDRIVIELLETMQMSPELVQHCRALKEAGFCLALDDHQYSARFHELYQVVEIVKIDLLQSNREELIPMVHKLRRYPLLLLAEKVETQQQFNECLELGFDLFQGYYFARPSLLKRKRLGESGSTLMRLMRLLCNDAQQAEIESVFRGDPGLTLKLLLLVNSVGIGLRAKIETVPHALAILGRCQLKRWVQLALLANDTPGGMENPLVDLAAVRAILMENLSCMARQSGLKESAFLTGILSILGQVYDVAMVELTAQLNLSDEICRALAMRQGRLGRLLHLAELLEQMDFGHLDRHLEELQISLDQLLCLQQKAFCWRGDYLKSS